MPEKKLIRISKVAEPIPPKLLSDTFIRWLKFTDYKFIKDLAFKEDKQALALDAMRIDYELVDCEGYLNLYDAYVDWWKFNMGYIVHNVHRAVNPSLLDPSIIEKLENKKAMDETEPEGTLFEREFGLMSIRYSIERGKGRPNLWQAYRVWWDKNEKLTSCWNGDVLKVPSSWKPQPFYPINPIEEKENTMQFKISRNQISNQIKKIEESLKNQKTRIISELNSIEEKISNEEPISGNLKEYHMYDLILRQLNYLKSFENVVEIICSEEEKDKIFEEIPCSPDEE